MKSRLIVGIVNYKCEKYIKQLLESLEHQSYSDFQVLVIDNNKVDKISSLLTSSILSLKYIHNTENTGFGAAHNIGIKYAFENTAEYYCALNPDMVLDKNYLRTIIEFLDSNKEYCSVNSRIYRLRNGEKTHTIDVTGGFIRRRFAYLNSFITEVSHDQFSIAGTSPVFRLSALKDISKSNEYFDPDYFLYFEDIDISWRLNHKSWKVRYLPEAIAWHEKGGSTDGKDSFFSKNKKLKGELLKNRNITMLKNLPGSYFLRLLPSLLITEAGIFLYFSFIRPLEFSSYLCSWLNVFKKLKEVLDKRRKIITTSRLTETHEFKFIFRGF